MLRIQLQVSRASYFECCKQNDVFAATKTRRWTFILGRVLWLGGVQLTCINNFKLLIIARGYEPRGPTRCSACYHLLPAAATSAYSVRAIGWYNVLRTCLITTTLLKVFTFRHVCLVRRNINFLADMTLTAYLTVSMAIRMREYGPLKSNWLLKLICIVSEGMIWYNTSYCWFSSYTVRYLSMFNSI